MPWRLPCNQDWRDVDLRVISDTIHLPYAPLETLAEVEAETPGVRGTSARMRRQYAHFFACATRQSNRPHQTELCFNKIILCIGPVAIVPFPEVFVEITLRLHQWPNQHTLCLSNVNHYYGYLPQRTVCAGHEVEAAKIKTPTTYARTRTM